MSVLPQFANYIEQPEAPRPSVVKYTPDPLEQPMRWVRPKAKSEGVIYVYFDRSAREIPKETLLKELDSAYVIEDRKAVEAFLGKNHVGSHLIRATDPLNEAFGKETIKVLTLVRDDEGCETLFCIVRMRGDLQTAEHALRMFDLGWWLGDAPKALGKLNFDFELV